MIYLFLWGRTGSGKSTSIRLLRDIAETKGWSCKSFNDYDFLRKMFETDTTDRFRATDHDGFEVLDLSVYEAAIHSLVQKIQAYQPAHEHTLVTIEFTSNNYAEALKFFDDVLLCKAYFFFITADLKTCLERVNQRTLQPITKDDYFVPEVVLLQHYPSPYMPPCISSGRAKLIANMGTVKQLEERLQPTLSDILSKEELDRRESFKQVAELAVN
jgi:hypothetical protein